MYRDYELDCKNKYCNHLTEVARVRCVRRCISPFCYRDVYEFDEVSSRILLSNF